MDALDFVSMRYGEIHARVVTDLLEGLTGAELRGRPHPRVNTVAWLVWHSARIEDVGVNRFLVDRSQVFDDGWLARLGVSARDVGTGMDDGEVDALSAAIDLGALRGYWDAVTRRTVEVLAGDLRGVDLDARVAADHVDRVSFGEGAVMQKASWLAKFWGAGRTRGWFLAQTPLLHVYGHYYEARVVAGLWGHASP